MICVQGCHNSIESDFLVRKLGSWLTKKQKLLHEMYTLLRQEGSNKTTIRQVVAGRPRADWGRREASRPSLPHGRPRARAKMDKVHGDQPTMTGTRTRCDAMGTPQQQALPTVAAHLLLA